MKMVFQCALLGPNAIVYYSDMLEILITQDQVDMVEIIFSARTFLYFLVSNDQK